MTNNNHTNFQGTTEYDQTEPNFEPMVSGSELTNCQENWGVMYVATGRKHIQAAIRSANSVHKQNQNLNIHLFSNWQECGFEFGKSAAPFTSLANIENPHSRSKVDNMYRSPFERTLFLDNDTKVLDDVTPLFQLLERFDIALSHANNRSTLPPSWNTQIPISFPQFNTGVIVFARNNRVMKLLQDWKTSFYQAGFKINDQLTMRELLWLSDLRIATIPPEYNLNRLVYKLVWHKWEARPKILHLHHYNKGLIWFIKQRTKVILRSLGLKSHPTMDRPPYDDK